jgi:hypothetical protein
MPMDLSNQAYQPVNIGSGFSEAFGRGAAAVPDLGARVSELLSTAMQQQGGMERTAFEQQGAMDRDRLNETGETARAFVSAAGSKDNIMKKVMEETANFARTRDPITGAMPSQEQIYAHAQDLMRVYQGMGAPTKPVTEAKEKKSGWNMDWIKGALPAAGNALKAGLQDNAGSLLGSIYTSLQPGYAAALPNIGGMAAGMGADTALTSRARGKNAASVKSALQKLEEQRRSK